MDRVSPDDFNISRAISNKIFRFCCQDAYTGAVTDFSSEAHFRYGDDDRYDWDDRYDDDRYDWDDRYDNDWDDLFDWD